MTHYFLDSSVASMVLDGDLWRRDPQRLVSYKPELKFSSHLLFQMEEKEEAVRSVVRTHSWARSVSQGDIRLWITPSVKAYLMLAPQVSSV